MNERNEKIKHLNNIILKLKYGKNDKRYDNNNDDLVQSLDNDYNYNNRNKKYKKNEKFLKESTNNYGNWRKINHLTKNNYMQERTHTPLIKNNKFYYDNYSSIPRKYFHKIDYSVRTEPNNTINVLNSHARKAFDFKTKYNYLQNKYCVEPLRFNN